MPMTYLESLLLIAYLPRLSHLAACELRYGLAQVTVLVVTSLEDDRVRERFVRGMDAVVADVQEWKREGE